MARKLDPQDMVSINELLIAEAIEGEALVNILVQKGIITKEELLEETLPFHSLYMKNDMVHMQPLLDLQPHLFL